MALKIKPTPKLDREDSAKFIERVESKANVTSHLIPTPKLDGFTQKLIKNAARVPQKQHN